MRKHNLLDVDVDLKELAGLTKNFSGAEISGTIN
jgi:vesicle-fusing ATPase